MLIVLVRYVSLSLSGTYPVSGQIQGCQDEVQVFQYPVAASGSLLSDAPSVDLGGA